MEEYILEMNHISKFIFHVETGKPIRGSNVKILDDVTFNLRRGEVHALLGENGAGKSTLMKILGGIIPPDEGEVLIGGKPVTLRSVRQARTCGVSFVHQELNLCTNINVARNFFLGNEPTGFAGLMPKRKMERLSRDAIAKLGFDVDPTLPLSELSTAQQQIVEIAKAISYHSNIIIMDEPTASLTKKEIDMLFDLIFRLKEQGVSIIYISHRLDEIQRIGDRMTVLRDGRSIGTMDRKNYSDALAIKMMAGRDVELHNKVHHTASAETVLEVKNVCIGKHTQPISIHVNAGEVVGLCGLVGAGRSELLKTVYGAHRSHGGEIFYRGEPYTAPTPSQSIQKGIVYLSEDRKLDGLILKGSVRSNITISALKRFFKSGVIRRRQETRIAQEYIGRFNVKCLGTEQLLTTLSGGNQQKISFAKCYATAPGLLLLDEPTRGIDVNAKSEIYRLIDDAAQSGLAVLVVSSEIAELVSMSDRIYIMREGSVTGEVCDPTQMTQEALVAKIIGSGSVNA